jgi:hypothetical protein
LENSARIRRRRSRDRPKFEIDVDTDNVHSAIVAYEFEGEGYQVKNTTEATGQVFREGDAVELVVDPAKPSRPYIVKLFA